MSSPLGSRLSLTAPDEATISTEPEARTSGALLALSPNSSAPGWQPILHASNQVVLYNPTSHALSIRHNRDVYYSGSDTTHYCPYCKQPLPPDFEYDINDEAEEEFPESTARAPNYFQLLEIANETSSRPSSPGAENLGPRTGIFGADAMAEGYFKAFFQEECKLGMGAYGSVFLCQHVLDGNALGHFAVKKIAVGESHTYLLQILREVRLLERLHHPNIITYHHAWLENCQFSSFGPKVPTLHVLMQWAEGGSLDDFIDLRLGRPTHLPRPPSRRKSRSQSPRSRSPTPTRAQPNPENYEEPDQHSRSARIRAFRAAKAGQRQKPELQSRRSSRRDRRNLKAVHLLSAEEVRSLFGDIVEGLAFLHDKAILHLDLKPGNVLLTWDEDQDQRLVLEYTSPESLPSPHTGLLQQIDSKADMWSLGMVLYKLLFFKLPYRYAAEGDANGEASAQDLEEGEKMKKLEREIQTYAGFRMTPALVSAFEARRLPRAYLILLESLLSVNPAARPTCERVLGAIREGRLDPVEPNANSNNLGTLISVPRRASSGPESPSSTSPSSPPPPTESKEGVLVLPHPARNGAAQSPSPTPLQRLLVGNPEMTVDTVENMTVTAGTDTVSRLLIPSGVWLHTLKSVILVGKILSIGSICANSYPNPKVVLILSVAAALDTWADDLWVCAALVLLHILVLRFWCAVGGCCVT
ncbi:hypothetical protein HWV62_14534 [Athelia sp. TMB]|nr:hypothetical protein HWV62_14534 [Athelia sp. TMB]